MQAALKKNRLPSSPPSAEPKSYFDAAFTACSNTALEAVYRKPATPPFLRLLMLILRFSTGFLKPEVILKEAFILEQTGMARSSIYKARGELLDFGWITIQRTQGGHCIYRLADWIQCLKGASVPPEERAARVSADADMKRPQPETFHYNKENKENNKHHQQPSNPDHTSNSSRCDDAFLKSGIYNAKWKSRAVFSTSLPPASELIAESIFDPIVPLTPTGGGLPAASPAGIDTTPVPIAPSIPPKRNKVTTPDLPPLTHLQAALVARLRHYAVNLRIADRLVRESTPEVVERALIGLAARREIRNPAGWLCEEIKSGGYKPPQALQGAENRQKVEALRVAEKAQAEAERDAQEQAGVVDREKLLALPPDELSDLKAEALKSLPAVISARYADDPNFPPLRALMISILRDRREHTRTVGRSSRDWGSFRREEYPEAGSCSISVDATAPPTPGPSTAAW